MANRIVVEVLEFVRPISLQTERVSVPILVEEAVVAARGQLGPHKASIVAQLSPTLPELDADRLLLRQLLTNLLINALEALAGAGHVWVVGSYEPLTDPLHDADPPHYDNHLTLEVTDDGPGIPDEITDRMFSPFITTKPKGSGLGLAIVRKIVSAHDGRIDVRPRAEGGTRFRVQLPVPRRRQSQRLFGTGERPVM